MRKLDSTIWYEMLNQRQAGDRVPEADRFLSWNWKLLLFSFFVPEIESSSFLLGCFILL